MLRLTCILALLAGLVIGCAESAPEPTPTPATDIVAIIDQAIAEAFNITPIPEPTPTLIPTSAATPTPEPTPTEAPTFTPTPDRLVRVPCLPPSCDTEYVPPWGHVEWIDGPTVLPDGTFTLEARIDERIDFVVQGSGDGVNYDNITLTDHNGVLYGSVIPPARPGWHWVPSPGTWAATEFLFDDGVLFVHAMIDPAAARHPGLEVCLWSSGTDKEQTDLLDCKRVAQP